ncbi:MAG: hypothetical protein LBI72_00785 [Flavobacteriaceae bacterium]|jgi:uncharacterized membrane protein HdeD (DUF308 family)|nr:hypothetical protein [Flavobacteriaceae bacterium]
MNQIVTRAQAPTPKFFKVLRNVGISLLAVSGAVLTAPITLPATIVTVAGYIAVAGGVLSAVSQVTIEDTSSKKTQKPREDE